MLESTVPEYCNLSCELRISHNLKISHVGSISYHRRWSPRGRPWPRARPRGHILKSLALASKPQVLGLGLEALGPRKLACPRLEDSTIFEPLKFC